MKLTKKRLLTAAACLILLIGAGLFVADGYFYAVPRSRLAPDATYPEMPQDEFHRYISLPIDHKDPAKGRFRGFYLLSPNFDQSKRITFLLTDAQMELVGLKTDFDFFEGVLQGESYVLIGVRGHSPTLFPEVFAKDGSVDYAAALNLYGSDQQVEDIESVRLDMVERGMLPANSKINVFGASGAGVLAQQYVSKYGANVERMILESTGAPDLAKRAGLRFSPDFKDFNPQGAELLNALTAERSIDKPTVCNVLYQLGRTETSPRDAQLRMLEDLRNGGGLWRYKLKPMMNLTLLNYIIKTPDELAARVRWFELVGDDLLRYDGQTETNLLYEISSVTVSDLREYHVASQRPAKAFEISRENFTGEVLILKGTEDVVFSDAVNIAIGNAYKNSKILFFKDGHRMQNDRERYRKLRTAFLEKGLASEEFRRIAEQPE